MSDIGEVEIAELGPIAKRFATKKKLPKLAVPLDAEQVAANEGKVTEEQEEANRVMAEKIKKLEAKKPPLES